MMASNFRISTYKKSKNLHLELKGDFDGSSACELLNLIKEYSETYQRMIIHTGNLSEVHPFGREVFVRRFSDTKVDSNSIHFKGDNEILIAPEKIAG